MGKIVKLKNKKTGVKVYPVTATKAVVDADSGERLNDTLKNKVEEAPVDGNQYVRINGTWGIAQMATSTKEKCIITLASNQGEGDAASLHGATVKVTDVDSQEVYHNGVWNGTEIALEFAPGVNYKVEVGAVADYATPESKTLTALEYNVRNLVMMYNTEVVSVTLSADNGASVIGQQVTINGSTSTWDGTAITKKIAYGTEYQISVNKKNGFISPVIKTYTASNDSRKVDMIYEELALGIFIQGISGKRYKKSEWKNQEDPNGIAVITENCQFVVSLDDVSIDIQFANNKDITPQLTTYETRDEAALDYNGFENTEKLIEAYGDDISFAPGACKNFIFPNGSRGYMPSYGEGKTIQDNSVEIEELLDLCGGSGFIFFDSLGRTYFSSTYYGVDYYGDHSFWTYGAVTNNIYSVSNSRCLRAVTSL